MIRRARAWFSHLSKIGKIGTVIAVLSVGTVAAVAASNPQPTQACTASISTETETESVPFDKTQVDDSNLDKGKTAVTTQGVDGEKEITKKITKYSPDNCKPSSTTVTKEETTKEPVDEVTSVGTKEPAPAPAPAPTPAPAPAQTQQSNCSPYYSPCVPNVSYDLDCPDIGMSVTVSGGDPYRLDADDDGIGCESY